jgi:WD40 repeat protein
LTAAGRVEGEQTHALDLQFCEDLGVAAARVGSRQVRVWNLEDRSHHEIEFQESVSAVGIDRERAELLVVAGGEIRAIDLAIMDNGKSVGSVEAERYTKAKFSPNGRLLAVEQYGGIVLWSRDAGKKRFKLPGKASTIFSMSLANTCLAVATSDRAYFYDLTAEPVKHKMAKLHDSPLSSTLSPDGKTLATGYQDGKVTGFDTASCEELWSLPISDDWVFTEYLTDSGVLCVQIEDELCLYDTATGKRVAHLRSENRWGGCWISEDGRTVLAGGGEGTLHTLRRNE